MEAAPPTRRLASRGIGSSNTLEIHPRLIAPCAVSQCMITKFVVLLFRLKSILRRKIVYMILLLLEYLIPTGSNKLKDALILILINNLRDFTVAVLFDTHWKQQIKRCPDPDSDQ